MKRLSVKQLLLMVGVGLLTMSGAAFGGGPYGNGDIGGKCGEGLQHQWGLQDNVIGVFETHCNGQCGGNCGEGEQKQKGRDDLMGVFESGGNGQNRNQNQNNNCGSNCDEGLQHRYGLQ